MSSTAIDDIHREDIAFSSHEATNSVGQNNANNTAESSSKLSSSSHLLESLACREDETPFAFGRFISTIATYLESNDISPPSLDIVCPAMLSGATQAVLFNPIDRALYLRVIMRRSLFHRENWANPFQGFANAGLHRMLSAGGYLVWQEASKQAISGKIGHDLPERVLVGISAGSIMGFSLNGLQLIKYRMWTEGSGSFWKVTRKLHAESGFRIFLRGTRVSIMRDAAFGLTYEVLRGKRNRHDTNGGSHATHFLRDTAAASVACWVSAPINYCRNIVYAVPPASCPLGVYPLLHNLYSESMRGGNTFVQRWNIMNSRLNLGWAALRVGLGVAVSQSLFEFYKGHFAP